MEPDASQRGRNMGGLIQVRAGRERGALTHRRELFGIPLFHHAETAKFPFYSVEITVVVGVARNEPITADAVVGLYTLDDVNGEGNPGYPGFPRELVGEIEPGRGRIMRHRLR